jgi:hypothetical protein
MPSITNMADKIFADGLHYELPAASAPAWLKGKLSVRVADFIDFLKAHQNERGFVNIDIKQSKGGNYYCELNQYRNGKKPEHADIEKDPDVGNSHYEGPNPDDIPF